MVLIVRVGELKMIKQLFILLMPMVIATHVHGQDVLVTAHRGASGYAPENTLSSVKKALEIGVDRIEVDVQQTSDGVVVCLHDKTLDRTTDSNGQVGKQTWEDVQKVKAYGKFENEFANEPIPTLEQIFELMDGKTQFVIEIKAGRKTYPGIEDNVVKLIKKYKAEKWALVHSFNDKVLNYLHENYPDIRLQKLFVSYSAGVMLDFKLHSVKLSKYDYVEGFGISKGAATEKMVKKIHGLGKVVHVWTVNSEEDIQEIINLGVDGVISNYPDRVKEILGRK